MLEEPAPQERGADKAARFLALMIAVCPEQSARTKLAVSNGASW